MRKLEESEIIELINENAEELAKRSGAIFMQGISELGDDESPIGEIRMMGDIVTNIGDMVQNMFPDLSFSTLGLFATKLAKTNALVYNDVAQKNAEKGS